MLYYTPPPKKKKWNLKELLRFELRTSIFVGISCFMKTNYNILKFGLNGTACKIHTHLPVDCILCMKVVEFKISLIGAGIVWIRLVLVNFILNGRNFLSFVFLCAICGSQYSCNNKHHYVNIMWTPGGFVHLNTYFMIFVCGCFFLVFFFINALTCYQYVGFQTYNVAPLLNDFPSSTVLLYSLLLHIPHYCRDCLCDAMTSLRWTVTVGLWHCSDWTFACLPSLYVISWQLFEILCSCLILQFWWSYFLIDILIIHVSALSLYLFSEWFFKI